MFTVITSAQFQLYWLSRVASNRNIVKLLQKWGEKKHTIIKKGGRESTRASRSSISRRQPKNRYSLKSETENVSASAKKLKTSANDYEINVDNSFGYRLINFIIVFSTISQLVVCKSCGSSIKFEESSCRGLGFKIAVVCEKCPPKYINASPLINNHAYDINRRIVFAMRLLGIGINGIKKFCACVCRRQCINLFTTQ